MDESSPRALALRYTRLPRGGAVPTPVAHAPSTRHAPAHAATCDALARSPGVSRDNRTQPWRQRNHATADRTSIYTSRLSHIVMIGVGANS
jgi:hypothetical protein